MLELWPCGSHHFVSLVESYLPYSIVIWVLSCKEVIGIITIVKIKICGWGCHQLCHGDKASRISNKVRFSDVAGRGKEQISVSVSWGLSVAHVAYRVIAQKSIMHCATAALMVQ